MKINKGIIRNSHRWTRNW